uniref:CCHC-type domain-containing protein n=1 Tax=Trichuris muris TaxID=70415 RepID=A0A5S6QG78_TRIMR
MMLMMNLSQGNWEPQKYRTFFWPIFEGWPLFGGVSEKTMACAFVAALPENLQRLLKASSSMEDLGLSKILARVRTMTKEERNISVKEACLSAKEAKSSMRVAISAQRCNACGEPHHFAKNCTAKWQQSDNKEDASGSRSGARNYDRYKRSGTYASKASLQGN